MIYHEDYLLIQAVALIAPVFYCGIPLNKYRGDVPGQTTQNPNTPQAEESKLMYYNIGMEDSLRVSEKGNESLNIYLRYFCFMTLKGDFLLKITKRCSVLYNVFPLMSKSCFILLSSA